MRSRERTHKYVTLTFVLILPLFMSSVAMKCGKKTQQNTNSDQGERTEQELDVDKLINLKVRENLTASTQVRATDIQIRTFKLEVTLDGTVSSEAERAEAIRITEQTEVEKDGVKFKVREVDASNLKVRQE